MEPDAAAVRPAAAESAAPKLTRGCTRAPASSTLGLMVAGPEVRHEDLPGSRLQTPWAREASEVARELAVDIERGLNAAEARRRLQRFGGNRLQEARPERWWRILLRQGQSLIVVLLAAAAVAAFLFGETLEAAAILAVIALNAAIGFATELRAVRSMEALGRLVARRTRVRRDGRILVVPVEQLVSGDVVLVEGGDRVPADLRVLAASKLEADESALTGESVPVAKGPPAVAAEAPLAERTCLLYSGTVITRGSGEAVVVATGMNTELGAIVEMVHGAADEKTPLERRLDRLGRVLLAASVAIGAVLVGVGIATGRDVLLMVETGIAMIVAAIPEGLPVVATIALARGMRRMAQRRAIVRRLAAVETLGSTGLILTDKTGTLTENRLAVRELLVSGGRVVLTGEAATDGAIDPRLREAIDASVRVSTLCNNATLASEDNGGDPLEVALLRFGRRFGVEREALVADWPERREEAFDADTRLMATFHERSGEVLVAVKGAPEVVVAASTHATSGAHDEPLDETARALWIERSERMAASGMRVLAVASKRVCGDTDAPYERLTLHGLLGLEDPPRTDVRAAIDACRGAGVETVIVTGDQPQTAVAIANAVGVAAEDTAAIDGSSLPRLDKLGDREAERIATARVFARVTPRQKLELIRLFRAQGRVVAMTGDGVNDAPALREADIGVAMGRRGTQVACEAADIVLQDDAFATIPFAIAEGRAIFSNIRKLVSYLLSCNLSEIAIVSLGTLLGIGLPLLPLQLLFLNLVTDVFPALALGVGRGAAHVMKTPPRPASEPLLTAERWWSIAGAAVAMTLGTLGAYLGAERGLGIGSDAAVTVSFLTLATAQLLHVFHQRAAGSGPLRNEITGNPWVWGALALCGGLLAIAGTVPGAAAVLHLAPIGGRGVALVLGASVATHLAGGLSRGLAGRTAAHA